MESPSQLLATGEVARLLGCSRQHVVNLCARGFLPFVWVGSHRRVRHSDLDALAIKSLTRDQERSLWLHRAVAGRLAVYPEDVIARARANLVRLREIHPYGMTAAWLAEWDVILDAGEDAVFAVLNSPAYRAVQLRQNSPFAGVLNRDERSAVLEAFRGHWRRAHAA